MTIALTNVTGSAQTGFTTPGYTIVADVAPDNNGKQYAVSALTGTQAGVTVHTVSSPFTFTYVRPKALKLLPALGNNGQYPSIPNNTHKVLVRKGVTPAASQPQRVAAVKIDIDIPAGSETYDAANVRALLSFAIGALQQISAGIGDTCVTGTM